MALSTVSDHLVVTNLHLLSIFVIYDLGGETTERTINFCGIRICFEHQQIHLLKLFIFCQYYYFRYLPRR
jgi:hypothetical protein